MSNRLPILQATIAEAHADVERHLGAAAERALAAGEMLVEAKALCPHGTWGAWLVETGISERSAQRYMRLHRAGFKSAMVAVLGMAMADRFAAAAERLPLPAPGRAICFVGRNDVTAIDLLAYVWPAENGLFGYAQYSIMEGEGMEVLPRSPVPPWLVGMLHADDAMVQWQHYSEVPLEEALAFRARMVAEAAS